MRGIFSCAFWPSVCLLSSLEKCLFRCSAHFFLLSFLFFDIELYELLVYFEGLSVVSCIVCVFSHSVGCLCVLLMVSSAVQKLLCLIRSHCLFLFLFPSCWQTAPKRYYCNLCQRAFCLFSSRSFMVSGLTFRSLI